MDPRSFVGLAGIPVVLAAMQLIKQAFPTVPSRYWPLVVLALAVGFNVGLAALMDTALGTAALMGILVGLSASGAYSWATTGTTTAPTVTLTTATPSTFGGANGLERTATAAAILEDAGATNIRLVPEAGPPPEPPRTTG